MRKRWLRSSLGVALAAVAAAGAELHPTGNRTTPPTLNSIAPQGIARGTTAEMTVEGLNLARTSAIYFSEPGVTGRILRVKELPDLPDVRLGSNGTPSTVDVGPLPPRNQVTVEVQVAPDAEIDFFSKQTRGDQTTYLVTFKNRARPTLHLAQDGSVLKEASR